MDFEWQTDWKTFVDVLAEQLRRGATSEDLAVTFGSKAVAWSGVLTEKLVDELAPLVTIALPEATIALQDSRAVHLSEQSVPVARDAVSAWQAIPIGTALSFTATLGTAHAPFPPVEVVHLCSGRTLVAIRLSDGRPRAVY
jgi:hypothetical protein